MRKLFMLAASALVAMALAGVSATAASAATYKVFTFDLQEYCPEVTLEDGEVSGGCLTEDLEGSVQLGIFSPYWTPIGTYEVTFDLVLDEDGDGYAVNPTVQATGTAFVRKACDEADGSPLPWAVDGHWEEWLELELDITIGMTLGTAQPGTTCTQQEINTVATEIGGYMSTELDQMGASANIQHGHFESEDDTWIDWDPTYEVD